MAELESRERHRAHEVRPQQAAERVPLDVLDLELRMDADAHAEPARASARTRCPRRSAWRSPVEAAHAQEGVPPDGRRPSCRTAARRQSAASRSSASTGSCTGSRCSWCRIVARLHPAARRRRPPRVERLGQERQGIGPDHHVGVDEEEILAGRHAAPRGCGPPPGRPGPPWARCGPGSRAAISRDRSVEPSSTTMTSKSSIARLWTASRGTPRASPRRCTPASRPRAAAPAPARARVGGATSQRAIEVTRLRLSADSLSLAWCSVRSHQFTCRWPSSAATVVPSAASRRRAKLRDALRLALGAGRWSRRGSRRQVEEHALTPRDVVISLQGPSKTTRIARS